MHVIFSLQMMISLIKGSKKWVREYKVGLVSSTLQVLYQPLLLYIKYL